METWDGGGSAQVAYIEAAIKGISLEPPRDLHTCIQGKGRANFTRWNDNMTQGFCAVGRDSGWRRWEAAPPLRANTYTNISTNYPFSSYIFIYYYYILSCQLRRWWGSQNWSSYLQFWSQINYDVDDSIMWRSIERYFGPWRYVWYAYEVLGKMLLLSLPFATRQMPKTSSTVICFLLFGRTTASLGRRASLAYYKRSW